MSDTAVNGSTATVRYKLAVNFFPSTENTLIFAWLWDDDIVDTRVQEMCLTDMHLRGRATYNMSNKER